MRTSNERGIAMITTLLVLMLISALLVGFTTMVMSDQRFRFIDRDRGQAFYAASGAVEKLTADLGNTFFGFIAPTGVQINNLVAPTSLPVISGVTYTTLTAPAVLPGGTLNVNACNNTLAPPTNITTVGTLGYNITYCADAAGNPTVIQPSNAVIKTGPYEGLYALQTPYQLDVTARTSTGGEVHLTRTIESVAIPVFQFGTFSDVDLSFFAGPNFNFGGRVHTNGSLYLAEGRGSTLTLAGKVTAVGEVILSQMQNTVPITFAGSPHDGTVSMATSSTTFRTLSPASPNEASVVAGPGSALNDPTWHNVSLSSYNSWIRNGRTGAKALKLPLLTVGGANPDLIRRPPVSENTLNPVLYNERLFTKASLRILLSDTAADITNLPGVTSTAPIQLDGDWKNTVPYVGYGPVDLTHAPIARSLGPTAATTTSAGTLAGAQTINVNAIPPMFQKPQITVKNTLGTTIVGPFTCTNWFETYMTGCTVPGSTSLQPGWIVYVSNPAGSATPGPGNMPGSPIPMLTLNNSVSPGSGKQLNFNATTPCTGNTCQTTWSFAANTFWLNDDAGGGTGGSTLVTCTDADNISATKQFQGCFGVPASNSGASITTSYASTQNTGTIGGYIKIERQDTTGTWTDVTKEILNYGVSDKNQAGYPCGDPTPNAIIRLERLRDNGGLTATCPSDVTDSTKTVGSVAANTTNSYEFWPQALYDTREGIQRDTPPANAPDITLGGVMFYTALDVQNLSKWWTAAAPNYNAGTGASSLKNNGGFTVYFSDRRNNRNGSSPITIGTTTYGANAETGEYGWEDFVNPTSATGAPSGVLDVGEDVNGNGVLDLYGGVPNSGAVAGSVPFGSAPLTNTATPLTTMNAGYAQVNRAILFRRALKLVNGNNIVGNGVTGLTVVSENPVYIQGDWNSFSAGGSTFGATLGSNPSAATAVIADAVTLLSNNWVDRNSFASPYAPTNAINAAFSRTRPAASWYRLAIIAGKGMAFPLASPTAANADFGTDGGVHNFLRFLEDGGGTVNYLGATATFFYNRQAVGTYKCCNTVYGPPTRAYNFDVNFQNPALLPPNTPVFRDMNAVGFSQELRPGK